MTTGEKIKFYREQAGISQRKLAAALNIVPQRISQYESGFRNPKNELLKEIASLFNIDWIDLLGDNIETEELKERLIDSIGDEKFREIKVSVAERTEQNAVIDRRSKLLLDFDSMTTEGQIIAVDVVHSLSVNPQYQYKNPQLEEPSEGENP